MIPTLLTSSTHIWISRPQQDAEQMAQACLAQGLVPWVMPVLTIAPYPIDGLAQTQLAQADLIIATSRHAITGAVTQGLLLPADIPWFAVGQATADSLTPLGIQAQLPEQQDTEGLLSLIAPRDVQHRQVLILKGVGGRPVLAQQLRQRGALVTELLVYQRQCTFPEAERVDQFLQTQGQKIILLASGETLDCLIRGLTDQQRHTLITNTRLVVISERVAQRALAFGWQAHHITVAPTASLAGLIQSIGNSDQHRSSTD